MEKLSNFLQDCWNFMIICAILVSLATPAVLIAGAAGLILWDLMFTPIPHVRYIGLGMLMGAVVFCVIDYFIIRWLVNADEEETITEE